MRIQDVPDAKVELLTSEIALKASASKFCSK